MKINSQTWVESIHSNEIERNQPKQKQLTPNSDSIEYENQINSSVYSFEHIDIDINAVHTNHMIHMIHISLQVCQNRKFVRKTKAYTRHIARV